MGDFVGSGAVIVAAVVIALTGWTAADAVASALIGLLILPRTFALLREATDVLLEATPKGVDMDHVRGHILDAPGVVDCHDLHAWTITSGMNVVSAHVVLADGRGCRGDARRAVRLPVRRLRHRALDLPARNGRSPPARGTEPRMRVASATVARRLHRDRAGTASGPASSLPAGVGRACQKRVRESQDGDPQSREAHLQ